MKMIVVVLYEDLMKINQTHSKVNEKILEVAV